jgi:HSP20 family protein
MGIVRFDPFRELDRLQSEVNRLFEGYNGSPERGASQGMTAPNRLWSPSVDVAENQNEIVLRAEVPGMRQEDIDIELTGDTLTIRGERRFENEERKDQFVRVERSYGRFQRSFTLGVPVQNDRVSATYRDGVLEVHLPKSEETKPRKVQVTVASAGSDAKNIMATSEKANGDGTKGNAKQAASNAAS